MCYFAVLTVLNSMASSSSSTASSMLFEDVILLCHSEEAANWFRRRGWLDDFSDED